MRKLIRDNKVAILIIERYGIGWYSWHRNEALLFDPSIVYMVENGSFDGIESYIHENYPDENIYIDSVRRLSVHFVPVGQKFRIDEYDGFEKIVLESEEKYIVA